MASAVKLGSERVANTTLVDAQFDPVIAALSDGRFVVAWTDDNESGLAIFSDIRAQVFNADGSPSGGELLVNTVTTNQQHQPSIATLADDRFVVVWTDQSGADGNLAGIFAQAFNPDGTKSGSQLTVNTQTTQAQVTPAVSGLGQGFVVAWEDQRVATDGSGSAIRARIFAGELTAGAEIQVNATTAGSQTRPAVASLADNRFVVVWDDGGVALGDLRAQIFNADGSVSGSEFQVNTATGVEEFNHTIGLLSDGRFIVTWRAGGDIRAQIFDANGTKLGSELVLNTTVVGVQDFPVLAGLTTGRFVAVWQDPGPGAALGDTSAGGLVAQVFNADGSKFGSEFLVNTTTLGSQLDPTITALDDGRFAVAFEDGAGDVRVQIFQTGVVREGDGQNNTLEGTAADDIINGNGGNDALSGLAGDDRLDGGSDADTMVGGLGDDTYVVDDALDSVTENAGEGSDTVETALSFYQLGDNVERLTFTGGASLKVGFGNILDNVLTGTSGSDSLTGNYGNDTYAAGGGSDYLYIDHLDAAVDAGEGYDAVFIQDATGTTLDVGAANAEWVYAWTGNDTLDASGSTVGVALVGEAGGDVLIGSAHNDYIYMDASDTEVDAGDGYDALFVFQGNGQGAIDTTIDVSAANAEWVLGGAGNDTVTNLGDDTSVALSGGGGNDTITGGLGNDYLFGNAGADTFVVTSNAQLDAVLDFEVGVDKVDLRAIAGISDFADLQAGAFEDGSGNTIFDLGDGNQLFLYQVDLGALSASDFLFGGLPNIVITEIMANPGAVADAAGEWFEITNAGNSAVDLNGWTVDVGGSVFVVDNGGPLLVQPGGFLVFEGNGDPAMNGGLPPGGYVLGPLGLSNSGETIALFDSGNSLVDQVAYGSSTSGRSSSLDPDATSTIDNDDSANWALSTIAYGLGDTGTPGSANPQNPFDLL